MKPSITLLFIIITLGCKKEKIHAIQSSIIGKWELSRRWGTIAGIDENFPAGNGTILEFSGNNFYRYSNTQLTQTGTYAIVEDTTSFTVHGKRVTFNVNSTIDNEKFVMIIDTMLTIRDYWADAESNQYRRLR
jgi:hypothetical protein